MLFHYENNMDMKNHLYFIVCLWMLLGVSLWCTGQLMAQDATSLRSSGVDGALNGNDHYVGQGLDLITNVALGDDFGLKGSYLKDTKLRIALGGFDAGSAYGTEDDEMAYRGLMELKFRF